MIYQERFEYNDDISFDDNMTAFIKFALEYRELYKLYYDEHRANISIQDLEKLFLALYGDRRGELH
mgnify:FL=1|tara:strand:- start:1899 stop:2096 length:198 start_codon:yes stop_codon:yes gene_type:complete